MPINVPRADCGRDALAGPYGVNPKSCRQARSHDSKTAIGSNAPTKSSAWMFTPRLRSLPRPSPPRPGIRFNGAIAWNSTMSFRCWRMRDSQLLHAPALVGRRQMTHSTVSVT